MTPAQTLVAAANLLDKQPELSPEAVKLVAGTLLLRGVALDPFPTDTQRFLCEREPSREFLAIADLILRSEPPEQPWETTLTDDSERSGD